MERNKKRRLWIIDLTSEGLQNYIGNYDYYLDKKSEYMLSSLINVQTNLSSESENAFDWKQQKETQAKQRKLENRLKTIESSIETMENRVEEINFLMTSPDIFSNVSKLQELNKEQEKITCNLSSLYEEWELLLES